MTGRTRQGKDDKNIKKRVKIAAGLLALGILGTAGVYGSFSDTLQVVNHISVGDIKISMAEYEKKGTKEVPYSNTGNVLPGSVVSKIPRITNHALPCWVRARVLYTNDRKELEGLDDTNLSGFSSSWIRRGEYYYYTSVLRKKESVDLFQNVHIPSSWKKEHELQKLGLTIQAEAIQAANFTPDFSAMSPWGNQLIQQCVHEENGTMTCKKPQTKLSVEFNGKAHKLLSVPGDFFTNLGTAMPGDVLTDTIVVSNTTDKTAEILFRTSTEGRSREQLAMLKEVKLTVTLGDRTLYKGTLDSADLGRNQSLGKLASGQKGNMKFKVEIPSEWDNRMAQKKTDVMWIFTVNEDETETLNSSSGDSGEGKADNGSSVAKKNTSGEKTGPVKTGDFSGTEIMFVLLLGSGVLILLMKAWKGGRRV